MRQSAIHFLTSTSIVALTLFGLVLSPIAYSDDDKKDLSKMSAEELGKEFAFNRKKGNCLACHKIAGGSLEGNIGPELVNMKARYPDKAKLRAQIWDATANNPNTIMPPFGKHKIVSEEEIDKIVEFIYSL